MRNIILIIGGLFFALTALSAQQEEGVNGTTIINGQEYSIMINDCGDTLIMAQLDEISISSPRHFKDINERRKYRRYKHYATIVYPYAVEAIRIFNEVDYATKNLPKRKRKKYIRKLQKDLKKEFQDPLKKLTKTQGYILTKMIERELDTPMYDLIKSLKGSMSAAYWGTLGRTFGYHLKEGYKRGKDLLLDMVLDDMNLSY